MSWRDDFADILTEDRPLAELSYYRIGGIAPWFFEPRDAPEAAKLLAAFRRAGQPYRILGGGANVLMDDGRHDRPFVHARHFQERSGAEGVLRVGAGCRFPRLVADTVRDGQGGLEVLAGIPGQMGGIVTMNAGGRHGEIADVLVAVEVATEEGDVRRIAKKDCGLAYRKSDLPRGLVTAVELALDPQAHGAAIQLRMKEIMQSKSASQPLKSPSSGCVFANPAEESAGRLIEELGLKGHRRGDAEISELHGNFILNRGQARFADVLGLVELVESECRSKRGLDLRREMQIWPAEESEAEGHIG